MISYFLFVWGFSFRFPLLYLTTINHGSGDKAITLWFFFLGDVEYDNDNQDGSDDENDKDGDDDDADNDDDDNDNNDDDEKCPW